MISLFSETLSVTEFSQLDLLLALRPQKKLDLHLYRHEGCVGVQTFFTSFFPNSLTFFLLNAYGFEMPAICQKLKTCPSRLWLAN